MQYENDPSKMPMILAILILRFYKTIFYYSLTYQYY